jgi:hypothetical protein
MAALSGFWQEARSTRFALLAFLAALLTSAGWLGSVVRTEQEGLVQALVLLAIPVVSTAGALALRRSRLGEAAILLCAVLLVLFQVLLGLSFGLSYLPAAGLMVIAAVSLLTERDGAREAPGAQRGGGARPGRGRGGRLTRAALVVTWIAAAASWLDMRYAAAYWGAEFTTAMQVVLLVLPVVMVAAAVALERTGLRTIARLAAAAGLLLLGVVGLPAVVVGLVGLPAVALLVVAAMLDRSGPAPARDRPDSPPPGRG